MKRILRVVLAASMLTGLLAGCSSGQKPAASTEGTGTVASAEESTTAAEKAESTAASADAKQDSAEKVLHWNVGAEPEALDPMLMGTTGMQVVNNTFEGLMRTYEGKLTPGIAEKYEISDDGLHYTFHLRDSKWSDGKDLVAGDFIYSWLRMIDPEMKLSYGKQFFYIKNAEKYYNGECAAEEVGFRAVDDKTIEVELVAPTPFFLALTAFNIYYPVREDVVDPEGAWSRNPETYVCNGPFKLSGWELNQKAVLEKNENYWNADSVKLDKIEVSFMVDESSVMTAYRAGEVDLFKGVPTQEVAKLQAEDPEFHALPMLGMLYYIYNVEREPFNDVRVRKALNMAMDREALVTNVTKSGEIAGTGNVTHNMLLSDGREFRDAAGSYYFDSVKVDEAKALLAEAGYPNGEGFPEVVLTYNATDVNKRVAEAAQQMWKENLNIDIKLESLENKVAAEKRTNHDFDMIRYGFSADYPDPMTYLSVWVSGAKGNYGQYSNEEFDKCIDDSIHTTGADRDKALLRAEEILMEDAVICPLYEVVDTCMIRSNVVGWDKTGFSGWFFGYTDITD